jgi:hypothetical protein
MKASRSSNGALRDSKSPHSLPIGTPDYQIGCAATRIDAF